MIFFGKTRRKKKSFKIGVYFEKAMMPAIINKGVVKKKIPLIIIKTIPIIIAQINKDIINANPYPYIFWEIGLFPLLTFFNAF